MDKNVRSSCFHHMSDIQVMSKYCLAQGFYYEGTELCTGLFIIFSVLTNIYTRKLKDLP